MKQNKNTKVNLQQQFQLYRQLIRLGLLWAMCSLPILTVGTSTTAVFFVTMKLRQKEEINVKDEFFKSFRQNLKPGIILWVIYVLVLAGFLFIYYHEFILSSPSFLTKMFTISGTILFAFSFLFIFPVLARYDNTIKQLIVNSFTISMKYFQNTIVIGVVFAAFVGLAFISTLVLVIELLFGMGILCYIQSGYLIKVFLHLEDYIKKVNEKDQAIREELEEDRIKADNQT